MNRLIRIRGMLVVAIKSVLIHKLRSALTILGLVFGVASVIVMLAVAEGASQQAQRQIASLGVRNIIVLSIRPTISESAMDEDAFEQRFGVTYEDLRRISDTIANVVSVTPLREFSQEARFGAHVMDARIVGVQPSYFGANRIDIVAGRMLDESDLQRRLNVCVIGEEVATKLFPGSSPIGKSVQVANEHFFRIVGIQKYKTPSAGVGSSLSAQDMNRDVVIPLTTDRSRIGDVIERSEQGSFSRQRLELSQITVEVADIKDVKPAAASLDGLLAKVHPQRDYAIVVPLDLLEQAQATQRIFNFVLGATAAISLLVGGIGIMNIMLATVSERTREIGVRRALGAKQSDIVLQFLIETAALSLFGTIIGMVVGLSVPQIVSRFSGMETVVTWWSVAIAAGVSLAVGIIFGIYPARQAARLDPIEALRHE